MKRTAQGAPSEFMKAALVYDGEDCLLWPFNRNWLGYAVIKHGPVGQKKGKRVNRLVCEGVYGPPPSDQHQAAHKCGNAGCVAPKHLRWATPKENVGDKIIHGTHLRGNRIAGAKLTENQVLEIIALYDSGARPTRIAKQFGISYDQLNKITLGKNWGWLTKRKRVPGWPNPAPDTVVP